jgi:hypothetical protein
VLPPMEMVSKLGTVLPVLGLGLAVGVLGCSRPSQAHAGEAAAAAPTEAAAAKIAGPRAEGQGFVVEVSPPGSAQVGAATHAKIILKPTGGYKVNKEFPTHLSVTAPEGVEIGKPKQAGPDAAKLEEDEAVFEVAFTASEPGDKRFEAAFRFAVCTPESCDPKSEKLAWTVPVTAK